MSGLALEDVTTPAEYVGLLRQLKERSGLTYRQLERRAAEQGMTLPRSTVASTLSRDTLPRVELVVALLKACGETDEEPWLRAYHRVAAPPKAPAPPEERPGRQWSWAWPAGIAVGALVAVAVAVPVVLSTARTENASPAIPARPNPDAPAEGSYRIRAVHSGLCFSEREGSPSGAVYQRNCEQTLPRYILDRLNDGSYRVRTDHPEFGPGCMGVRRAATNAEAAVVDGECGTGNAELFNVESVGSNGFRLRALHSNLCVGITDGEKEEWVSIRQVACDSPASAVVLAFDPVTP